MNILSRISNLIRRPTLPEILQVSHMAKISSTWIAEVRDKETGKLRQREEAKNIYTTQGAKALLDIGLHASTQITTWYVAPFSSNTTPDYAMTYAVPVYTEFTAYSEATRQEYVEAAATNTSTLVYTTNTANKATLTCTGSATVYGAALVGGGSAAATKGNTAGGGTMLCCVKYSTGLVVDATTTLSLAIQVNITI